MKLFKIHTEENGKDVNFGIYNLSTGRRAIGFQITPPPIATSSLVGIIKQTLKTITIKDVAVQIITYSSKDIY